MIVGIGDNIISSLGFTTTENYSAVKSGVSGVKHCNAGTLDLPESFMASLIDRERLNDCISDLCKDKNGYTLLEKAAMLSVATANREAQIDLSSPKVLFIFSSTKGNVDLLSHCHSAPDHVYLWHTAQLITGFFGNENTPAVVSNACISGACAQIAAMRRLSSGEYDYAVVIGVDFLSKFIVSGFHSFRALSSEVCRPFDAARTGLNLGEAASVIIYGNPGGSSFSGNARVSLSAGAVRNDANHISGPSRTGEGSFLALQHILQGVDTEEIAFVNAHGTATVYNDAMESVALVRAGLQQVPANSLKGYFGHTLGAAGVLETVISMCALKDGIVLPTHGFKSKGDDCRIPVSDRIGQTEKKAFIKMLSGFGGCNAALLFTKNGEA
jgi:3-oxoacyl-[acyl-carrier-protein] synthase-1